MCKISEQDRVDSQTPIGPDEGWREREKRGATILARDHVTTRLSLGRVPRPTSDIFACYRTETERGGHNFYRSELFTSY